jgi:hypothetical protein
MPYEEDNHRYSGLYQRTSLHEIPVDDSGLCFITVAMDGFDTAIIGFIASDLVQEWGVEKSALGPVMSAALVGWRSAR